MLFPLQQCFGVTCRHPEAIFRDSNRDNVILALVDGVENRGGGEQGNLMFTRAAAEKDTYAEFLHRIFFPNADAVNSTAKSAVRFFSSSTGLISTISKLNMPPRSAIISMARCASRYVAPPRTG